MDIMRIVSIYFLSLLLVITTYCSVSPSSLHAAGLLFRAGYIGQQIETSEGYGLFLKDRFGVEDLTATGAMASVVYLSMGGFGLGLEQDLMTREFEFNSLSKQKDTGKLTLLNTFLTFHFMAPLGFDFSVGMGSSQLLRELPGYQVESITEANLNNNIGKPKLKTDAEVAMCQVIYRIINLMFGLEIGLRFTQTTHQIPEDDRRPALDEQGKPIKSDFNLSGLGGLATVSLTF